MNVLVHTATNMPCSVVCTINCHVPFSSLRAKPCALMIWLPSDVFSSMNSTWSGKYGYLKLMALLFQTKRKTNIVVKHSAPQLQYFIEFVAQNSTNPPALRLICPWKCSCDCCAVLAQTWHHVMSVPFRPTHDTSYSNFIIHGLC
jgi:hypothetical protein